MISLDVAATKIDADHLLRTAVVYVRQSTVLQVVLHQESTERQYDLRQRAVDLGWSKERVDIIDEDQGLSAASAEHRPGFQRLVAAVGLGQIGIVLMLEASRLARSCSDWHRLIEICSVASTLIADEQAVYDPRIPNDRLLLGVKGTLSEAELFTMRTRLHEGRWNKARKGELHRSFPTGYVVGQDGTWAKDPDERVRDRIAYVFETFRRLGVARQVLVSFREEKLRLPVKEWGGPQHGRIVWKEPTYGTIIRMLHNPAYAGTYAYGQWEYDGTRRSSKTGKTLPKLRALEQWPISLQEHHEGYLSWDEFLRNQRLLRQNGFHSMTRGAPREGHALLQGIVQCGHCGARMGVHSYSVREKRRPAYICAHAYQQEGTRSTCQSMSAGPIDIAVAEQFIEAMTPAQLEVSLQVVRQVKEEKEALKRQWEHQVEQARYEALLAERQYYAVDPDNRLVARTLEARWNEKLEALQRLERAFEEAQEQARFSLTEEEEEQVRALAQDLPAIWNAPSTTDQERKKLLRYAISEVQLDGVRVPGRIEIRITWRTGAVTVREVDRLPVGSWAPRTGEEVIEHICALAPDHSATEIVDLLNQEGLRTAHGKKFRNHHVLYIARTRKIKIGKRSSRRSR